MPTGNRTGFALTTPSEMEVVATRVLNAPRELVFKAYTDPTLVARWWSPPHQITIVDKMDVRVGGAWRYIVQDKVTSVEVMAFNGQFQEITPPERIVRTENFEPIGPGHESISTVIFEELEGGRTQMTETISFKSIQDRDRLLESGMEWAFIEILELLDKVLDDLKASA